MAAQRRPWEECERLLTAPGSPFEMEWQDVAGRQVKYWKHSPPNMRAFLLDSFAKYRDNVFLSSPVPEPAGFYDREYLTFGQVYDKAIRLAGWLRDRGVRQNSRIAIVGGNSTGWVVAYVAINLLGAVPVIVNSTLVADALVHCLAKTNPEIVLVESAMAELLAPRTAELKSKNVGPLFSWSSVQHLSPLTRQNVGELGDPRPSQKTLREVSGGKDIHNLNLDSDGSIFFTSGTTSMPKAVLSTQRGAVHSVFSGQVSALRWFLRQGGDMAKMPPVKPASTLLAVPMFHVTGCLSWLLRFFRTGSKAVFMRKWNIADAIKLIKDEKVEIIGGVPAIITAILQSPLLPPEVQFTSMSYGGAPSSERQAGDLKKRFPNCIVTHGYGMTETNAVHSGLSGGDYIDNPGSVGRAIPGCEIRITHPDTKEVLPVDQIGIIEMRGYTIMKEYLNDPAATAAALDKDGWLNSGDIGSLDGEGKLFIRDRKKDIIIRGGENIASVEVENAMAEDDRIAEVAAIPVPCTLMGERVGVAVSLAPGATATEAELMEAVEPRLRYPARPAIIYVSDSPLPRNANGKVLKNEVKQIVGDVWERENRAAKYSTSRNEVRAKL